MSVGKSNVANGRFVFVWDYNPTEDTLDTYLVPTDPSRHIQHNIIDRQPDGRDVTGSTEYRQDAQQVQQVINQLISSGDLPATYKQDAINAEREARRQLRLARIAALEEEAAALKEATDG